MFKAFIFLHLYFLVNVVSAHSGRTDAYGGHNKYSDGTYHYHNSGTMGNSSGDWSIFIWLVVLFIVFIIGLFIWSFFTEGENNRTPIPNTRREASNPNNTTSSSKAKRRGEDSRAAKATREEKSSDQKVRGENSRASKAAREAASSNKRSSGGESTAAKALKKVNSTSDNAIEPEDLYFDNRKNQQPEKPSKENSDDKDDDLYFDNRFKK